ncbi:MAG: phosphatase PAP2 family protein [Faecalibacillus sp.]
MKTFYKTINTMINRFPFIRSCIFFLSKFCPYVIGVFYSLFVLKLYLEQGTSQMLHLLYVPFIVALICFCLRIFVKRQRPWQKYDFIPVDDKNRGGHSFPSIHVGLALAITLCVMPHGPNMSLLLMTMTVIVIMTRLLTGLHYISDIVFSIALALLINFIL